MAKKIECPVCRESLPVGDVSGHVKASHPEKAFTKDTREFLKRVEEENKDEISSSKRTRLAIGGVCIAIVVVLAIVLAGPLYAPPPKKNISSGLTVDRAAGIASFDGAKINTTVVWFIYNTTGGVQEKIFAVRDSNGDLHVAMDACNVCYKAGKGYRQSGSQMMCNNCGMRFAITDIGDANTGTGCWPSHITTVNDNGIIKIQISQLDAKAYMFP